MTTNFVESDMLLAVIAGDYEEAKRLGETMTPTERINLWGQLDTMQDILEKLNEV